MYEVDVKNVTEEQRRGGGGGGDQLRFGVLIRISGVYCLLVLAPAEGLRDPLVPLPNNKHSLPFPLHTIKCSSGSLVYNYLSELIIWGYWDMCYPLVAVVAVVVTAGILSYMLWIEIKAHRFLAFLAYLFITSEHIWDN